MPYKLKTKQVSYQNHWMRKRRLAWLHENGPCRRCGSSENLRVDHVDPAQKTSHRIWSYSEIKRLAELAKCQVLCYECHLRKTKENSEHARGSAVGSAKLTELDVREARRAVAAGEAPKDVHKRYAVDKTTFYAMLRGATWKHVSMT